MLGPLLRGGALYLFWRRHLRERFKGLAIAIVALALINLAHHEALAFFKETERIDLIPYAFYLRWIGWGLTALVYYYLVENRIPRHRSNIDTAPRPIAEKVDSKPTAPDGFDHLRTNTPLRSRADLVLEKKKNDRKDQPH